MTLRQSQIALALLVVLVFTQVNCGQKEKEKLKVMLLPGAIPIVAPAIGQCDASPRTQFLDFPADNLAVQWKSTTGVEYSVVFQANNDPFNPAGDTIDVPASGIASTVKTVLPQAQTDCKNGKNCVYPYIVELPNGNLCMPAGAADGLVIKPGP
jgi:hypothetical protein